jgi:anti-anti-sigma factor
VPVPSPLPAHCDGIRPVSRGTCSRIRVSRTVDVATVTLVGEFDLSTLPELRASLMAVGTCANVIVDLGPCAFIEILTARALAAAHAAAAARGDRLVILLPSRHAAVTRSARLTGLADAVPCFGTLAAATAGLRRMDAAGVPAWASAR